MLFLGSRGRGSEPWELCVICRVGSGGVSGLSSVRDSGSAGSGLLFFRFKDRWGDEGDFY